MNHRSLQVDGVEQLEQHFVDEFDLEKKAEKIGNTRYNQFFFLERRVGAVLAVKRGNFYKIAHSLVPDNKEIGDVIDGICTLCRTELMWNTKRQSYYCPRCRK
jgi:exosome complex RNA-binding protein Csl4